VLALILAGFATAVAEVLVFVAAVHRFGVLLTVATMVAISVLGCRLVRRVGVGVIGEFRRRVRAGRVPGAPVVDGVLVVSAGVLLATPGFLTDAVGLLLIAPPVRAAARRAVRTGVRRHVGSHVRGRVGRHVGGYVSARVRSR